MILLEGNSPPSIPGSNLLHLQTPGLDAWRFVLFAACRAGCALGPAQAGNITRPRRMARPATGVAPWRIEEKDDVTH